MLLMELVGGVRPEENLGVAGMRNYQGSAIFCGFEAQKMTFVIDPDPRIFFFKCDRGGGGGGGKISRKFRTRL